MIKPFKNHRFFWPLFLFSLLLLTCEKDKEERPYYYVNFKIMINQPQYATLQAVGNAMVLKDDVYGENLSPHGVIVYRLTTDEFKAYERTCPYKPSDNCAVSIDSTGTYAACPCCGSHYLLHDGYPSKGISEIPLTEYFTSYNGSELFVYSD